MIWWNGLFIKALLHKMGFDHLWIQLMIECISSIQYMVLLNGQPKGHKTPHCGLCQGDPLSSYLFIMYTKALIANIKKAEKERQITGMKVASACPSISHLTFIDEEECQAILSILKEYEGVLGQQINFKKTSIQFGHKIEESTKHEIRGVLGIQNLVGIGSYLGIPENLGGSKLGGSKTQVFGFIQEW